MFYQLKYYDYFVIFYQLQALNKSKEKIPVFTDLYNDEVRIDCCGGGKYTAFIGKTSDVNQKYINN